MTAPAPDSSPKMLEVELSEEQFKLLEVFAARWCLTLEAALLRVIETLHAHLTAQDKDKPPC